MKFEFNGQHVTGLEMVLLAGMHSFVIIFNLIISMTMVVPAYSVVAWLVSLTPVGTWVAEGLKLLYISAQREDLYKLGAAFGFVKGFLLRSGVNQPNPQIK